MKQVYIIKDAYQDNSVRVNYFEKDAIIEFKQPQWNESTNQIEMITINNIYNNLLFCERLFWQFNETELDNQIEEVRKKWEENINN